MSLPPMNELLAFQKVASRLSFARAAEELSLTPSTLSHLIRSFEERTKTRLFNRTTRSVSLTEAGQKLFEQLTPILTHLSQTLGDVESNDQRPIGTVRISTNETAAPILIERIDAGFRKRFPDVHFEVIVDNRLIDIVADGFDAGVRLRDDIPQDMIAVPIVERFRFVTVASPHYLRKNGVPKKPTDLLKHNCIGFRFESGRLYSWDFEKRGMRHILDVKGTLTTNDPRLMLDAAKEGFGIAYLAESLIQEPVRRKELTVLLDEWCPDRPSLCLYYPKNRRTPPTLRAAIDALRENSARKGT